MYETDDGTPCGIVAFNSIDRQNKHAFWAYYAAPDCPRGTGARMEFLALDESFSVLGLQKLSCEVLGFNTAVVRLHEKFGFVVEGVFKQHHKYDDAFVDVVRLAITSEQWNAAREKMKQRLK